MNPIYYIMIFTCILTMIGMVFHVSGNVFLSTHSKKLFILVFLGVGICAFAEMSRTYMSTVRMLPSLYKIVTLIEFCTAPFLSLFMSQACEVKKPVKPFAVAMLIHTAAELLLLPFGKIFYIDESGSYIRGDWYFLYILSYSISLIYLLITFFYLSKRFRKRDFFTLLLAFFAMLSGVLPSVIKSEIRTSYLGLTMLAIMLYCYYEGLTQQDMADDLAKHNAQIHSMQEKMIIGIADLIESRDNNTGTHIRNTSNYVGMLALACMEEHIYPEIIDKEFISRISRAAPLHDVGKISVPDSILKKPGRLTPEEFEIMKLHAPEGGRIVRDILKGVTDESYTQLAYDVATYHHEKWNGTGYPEGLSGDAIPVSARIMAIADVYDALTMERVYKKPMPAEQALQIISEESGSHFDPSLATLFVNLMGGV